MARPLKLLALVLLGCASTTPAIDGGSDATSSVDAATREDAAALAIDGLRVEPNPTSVLSCFVSWTTAPPATSIVDFGEGSSLAWRVHDDAMRTEHRVLVFGLHAETLHRLRVRSVAGTARADAETTFTTGTVPASIPDVRLDVPARAGLDDAWTLFGAQVLGDTETTAMMIDRSGRLVWYRQYLGRDPAPVTYVAERARVLFGVGGPGIAAIEVDLAGAETWRGPPSPATRADGVIHHEYRALANGHYALLRGTARRGVFGDILEEMASDGSAVWQWDVFDTLTAPTDPGTWTHGNALDLEGMPGRALYSAAALDTIFAIDRATGAIVWRLGAGGSFAPDPDEPSPWFLFQHDPVVLPNGHLLVYDDGRQAVRETSRVVEYALDETTMQADLVWRYPPDGVSDVWFTRALGGVERLASGHTVITAGSIESVPPSRIFEVTPAGETVWQITALPIGTAPSRIFRSQQLPPFLEPIPATELSP